MDTTQPSLWFLFYKDQLLLERKNGIYTIPFEKEIPITCEISTIHDITTFNNYPCRALTVINPPENNGQYAPISLRESYNYLPYNHFTIASKAYEILYFDTYNRFCPVCGVPLIRITSIFKQCPACKKEVYPSIAVAILALVRKDDSVLLVHAHNFKGKFQSLVAGFLETGETLEECVQREVLEETGLKIKNITYFDNQPWAFPSNLMVGFIADYDSGEIMLQHEELSFGAFYTKNNLPELPGKPSLARKMIDWWIEAKPHNVNE
ncbi:NADH pyrophosphatase [termite gut metagenome]|uniref:NAD(+) diphosphatase n=1 Tax=termite gut metagenome TaxID=433724 RepID=A0A5J4RKH8_9ZZZZ